MRRDCTWLERVPAAKRAMNSFSWAIFFSRWAFCDSICERTCVLATHHVVVSAGVGDDGFVIDVRDVRADTVQKVTVVGNHNYDAVVVIEEALQPVN